MLDGVEPKPKPEFNDRLAAGWRVIVSAWVIVAVFVILCAGAQALAAHHAAAPRGAELAGAVIPRHDPASAGVGVPCSSRLEECGKSAAALTQEIPYGYPLW
jgi:hypothetical protein